MLEALLQVSVNGPDSNSDGAKKIVKEAVSNWLCCKERKKLAKKNRMGKANQNAAPKVAEAASQTDPVIIADQEEIREEIRAAVKSLARGGHRDDEYSSSESDLSDGECDNLKF